MFFWDHPFPIAVWLLLGQVWKTQKKIKRIWPVLLRPLLALRFPMYYVLLLPAFTRRHDSLATVSSLLVKVDPCSKNQQDVVIKCTPLMYFFHFSGQTMTSRVGSHTENNLNPSPPGLLAHPWVPGGGLITPPPPAISRTVVRRESCEAASETSRQDAPESLKWT